MIESSRSADACDIASDVEMIARDAALSNRVRYNGVSPINCTECDEPIGEVRRRLLPGVQHCVDCASALEASKGKR